MWALWGPDNPACSPLEPRNWGAKSRHPTPRSKRTNVRPPSPGLQGDRVHVPPVSSRAIAAHVSNVGGGRFVDPSGFGTAAPGLEDGSK